MTQDVIKYDQKKKKYYYELRRKATNHIFYFNSRQEARDHRTEMIANYDEIRKRHLQQADKRKQKETKKEVLARKEAKKK